MAIPRKNVMKCLRIEILQIEKSEMNHRAKESGANVTNFLRLIHLEFVEIIEKTH